MSTRIIGLTGPIASGKNEVARILRRHKIPVIDADKLAHTLYYTQRPVWRELVRVFGSKILNRGGKINRRKLGEIVFADTRKLQQLNRIIHPYLKKAIIQEIESRTRNIEHRAQDIIINAAVLKEIGLVDYVGEVWVVMATRAKRLRRLLKKGLTRKQANARLRAQLSQKEYLRIADVVISNNGTLHALKKQLLDLPLA